MKKLFTIIGLMLALGVSAQITEKIDFTTGTQTAGPQPVNGSITYTGWKYDATGGFKIGNDNNGFAWAVPSKIITGISIEGYINTSTTTGKYFGCTFTTDGGVTWGNAYQLMNDGQKSIHTYTIPASAIPAGCNGVQIVRNAGTTTYIKSCTLTMAKGNPILTYLLGDSVQAVYSTLSIDPIYYHIENDSLTTLDWTSGTISGVSIKKLGNDGKGDTLLVSGSANAAPGTYPFKISAKRAGVEKAYMGGSITIANHLWAKGDTIVTAYTGEAMDNIIFGYYTTNPSSDITLTWNNTPSGISGSVQGSTYVISGTPTTTGSYTYTISIAGGNTITGKLVVEAGGHHDILYIYKEIYPTNLTVDDQYYLYLQQQGYDIAARKQQVSGLRSNYDCNLIILAESADADNAEVLAVAQGSAKKPVLNMKNFTYGPGRLDWGTPDVGTKAAADMTISTTHQIFTALNWANGSTHTLFGQVATRALMCVYDIKGGTALATSPIRARNYDQSGKTATFMEERSLGGKKYILLPMAYFSSAYMTQDAKNLLKQTVEYLLH